MPLPSRKNTGDPWLAEDFNKIVDTLRRLTVQFRVSFEDIVPSWWLGQLDATGQAPYTDSRYWVKKVYCNSTAGSSTEDIDETSFSDASGIGALQVTVTNMEEITKDTHLLPVETIVQVWETATQQSPRKPRFLIWAVPTSIGMFPVRTWKDGGTTPGTKIAQCDYTYKVRTIEATAHDTGGILLGNTKSPECRDQAVNWEGKLDFPPSATGAGWVGAGYFDIAGTFHLWDAGGRPYTKDCP